MNARDELTAVITDHPWLEDAVGLYTGLCPSCPGLPITGGHNSPSHAAHIAQAILAAGYSRPRHVRTVVELEAMAKGSVILSHLGGVWTKYYDHFRESDNWEAKGASYLHPDDLPATVLYEPEQP